MQQNRVRFYLYGCALAGMLCQVLSGCAPSKPTLVPVAPLAVESDPDGRSIRIYDTNGDGVGDYAEERSMAGRNEAIQLDVDGDGVREQRIVRKAGPHDRQLVLILDSIPFDLVKQQYDLGRFRWFDPPVAVIAPFPAVTDVCLDALFHTPASPGIEAEYYDGRGLRGGFSFYSPGGNSPWLTHVDVFTPFGDHANAYWRPHAMLAKELAAVERYLNTHEGPVVAYLVATSGLGYAQARDGHDAGLVAVDRFCAALMQRFRGALDITLLSDHGHTLMPTRRPHLVTTLQRMGYRVGGRLERTGDVVLPNFGMVNYAGLYTREPAQLAADVVAIDGVELSMYRAGDAIVVCSADGRARVSRHDDGYRYEVEFGDPLQLLPLLGPQGGALGSDRNFADHVYPDALDRIYRAFDGQVKHPPDVLISLADGWHWGSPFFERFMYPQATHGNLNRAGSIGFAMTTAGTLPAVLRTRELRDALQQVGVHLVDELSAVPAVD
jgi:hypothetical protein